MGMLYLWQVLYAIVKFRPPVLRVGISIILASSNGLPTSQDNPNSYIKAGGYIHPGGISNRRREKPADSSANTRNLSEILFKAPLFIFAPVQNQSAFSVNISYEGTLSSRRN